MYQGANNYSLPQGSYDPRTTPQITINTGASYAGGYGPGDMVRASVGALPLDATYADFAVVAATASVGR
ncbi:hypothetical protein A1O3_10320 [Capronia epimyces CBS 606.96]|uniref:Uncharacterized protein n=1 Tax=Capronia epimyces CBS 606.96 TaxID=1182542 RepID=W9X9L9_9EURO|nr:uncharacterized protein A1O3_10320 [Capronia epimyces CBS 606.96]EXJ77162.1 hypothetical protein A1O3_10320 [Capronia epimyces CBS 606.96]